VAQVVEWLPSKAEALSSNPATEKKTKKKISKVQKRRGRSWVEKQGRWCFRAQWTIMVWILNVL
jgi:hypothetical protein